MSAGPGLVEQGILRQSEQIALIMRNAGFVLVSTVYLLQTSRTVTGVALFGVVFVWSLMRLATRTAVRQLLIVDVALVVIAALLESAIVPAALADPTMASTRMIAYPAVVSIAIAQPKRWSFAVMVVIVLATTIGDLQLYGALNTSISIFVINWWAATWVRRLVLRAAADTDAVDDRLRRIQLREQVAAARIRFEREQFALLHDTASSTLMMVADTDRLDPDRLARQAARDVALLTDSSNVVGSDREIDLVTCVEAVSAEFQTPTTVRADGPVVVSQPVAAAVSAAVRESLNNVDRHARADSVRIGVEPECVTVVDDGIGFDPARPRHGFGLRASIEARMHRAGGSAVVSSAIGAGTVVSLTWNATPPEDDPRDAVDVTRVLRSYQYGLAIAAFLVLLETVLIVYAPARNLNGLTVVIIALLVLTGPVVAVMVSGRFAFARWPLCLAVWLLAHLFLTTLPTSDLMTQQNWVVVPVSWATVALLSGWMGTKRRAMFAAAVVVANWLVFGAILVWMLPTGAIVEYVGYNIASVATMQVAALAFGWFLARSVRRAEAHGRQQHAAATQLAVEQAVQADYRQHFATLTAEIVGLLRGLADRSLTADDASVQRQARAEYSRLRQLFAQADSFEHPLMQRLRPAFDAAAERGVDVTFDVQSRPPDLAVGEVERVAAAIDHLVAASTGRVRLVVSTSADAVTVSVVSDCPAPARIMARDILADSDFQLTVTDTVTWLRVHLRVLIAA